VKHRNTLILTGLILAQTLLVAAPEPNPSARVVGIRSGLDGAEFYYSACNQVLEDARAGIVTSEATPRCGNLTPLHMAVIHEPDLVAVLLEAGVDVETIGTGASALHLALRNGEFAVANELLAAGADPHSILGDTGWTTLHSLYESGKSEDETGVTRKSIAEHLVFTGVNVNAVNIGGMAPLNIAALKTDGVRELLDLGADATTRDVEGVPVDFYAALQGDEVNAERLRVEAGNPTDYTLEGGQNREQWVEATRRDIDELLKTYPAESVIVESKDQGLSFHAHDGRCHDECRREYNARISKCERDAMADMVLTGVAFFGNLALGRVPRALFSNLRGFSTMAYERVQCQRRAERKREECWDDCDASVGLMIER